MTAKPDKDALERRLPPGISLAWAKVPGVRRLGLYLLDPACLDRPLSGARALEAQRTPPYWALAWASGQVLAAYIEAHPELVEDKHVLDFGSGSGVVALAAKQAGARVAVAMDRDEGALEAAQLNAETLGLTLAYSATLETERFDVLFAADVLYDRDNVARLDTFRSRADVVIVAESRFDRLPHPAYAEIFAREACTYPDIDESATLKYVRLFRAHGT